MRDHYPFSQFTQLQSIQLVQESIKDICAGYVNHPHVMVADFDLVFNQETSLAWRTSFRHALNRRYRDEYNLDMGANFGTAHGTVRLLERQRHFRLADVKSEQVQQLVEMVKQAMHEASHSVQAQENALADEAQRMQVVVDDINRQLSQG